MDRGAGGTPFGLGFALATDFSGASDDPKIDPKSNDGIKGFFFSGSGSLNCGLSLACFASHSAACALSFSAAASARARCFAACAAAASSAALACKKI